jgi:hypothetical protein
MNRVRRLSLAGLAAFSICLSLAAQAQERLPYRNPALPVEQRVAELLSRMTLEERLQLEK